MMETISESPTRRTWRLHPGMYLLAIVLLGFIGFSLPPYLAFDPALSRVPVPADVPGYFPLLVAHVVFASVAMVTCWFQVWPWLRRRHPAVHRRMGRIYLIGGVFPAGLCALAIGVVSPFGPINRVGNVLMGVLWLSVTAAGLRAARQRRFGDHRRWMIRSFALTLSIITNRVWAVLGTIVLTPYLDTTFGGSEIALRQAISGLSAWLGFATALLLSQWWLDRKPRSRGKAGRASSAIAPELRTAR